MKVHGVTYLEWPMAVSEFSNIFDQCAVFNWQWNEDEK